MLSGWRHSSPLLALFESKPFGQDLTNELANAPYSGQNRPCFSYHLVYVLICKIVFQGVPQMNRHWNSNESKSDASIQFWCMVARWNMVPLFSVWTYQIVFECVCCLYNFHISSFCEALFLPTQLQRIMIQTKMTFSGAWLHCQTSNVMLANRNHSVHYDYPNPSIDVRCILCHHVMAYSFFRPFYLPGPWFNIKMTSYQYRKSHCGDKTILRPSYLHNRISYTDKMASLYWIKALISSYVKVPPGSLDTGQNAVLTLS